jgi:hypothetical protein
MTLWVHVHGGYASYEGTPHEWGQAEFDAMKLVQTLKGNAINGYATLKKLDGGWATFRTGTPEGAFDLWGQWAGAKACEILPGGGLLVPVPSSTCLAIGADVKGRKLAEAAQAHAAPFTVTDALHWAVQFAKSAEGGPRDPRVLFENLRVLTQLPKREVVLVDDVVTGGGHLIACARALRWAGHKVEHAICAALTVHAPPSGGMWNIPARDLEAAPTDF